MAAAELQSGQKLSKENDSGEFQNTIEKECDNYKETATEYLVMRDFTNCERVCLNGISFTKQHVDEECAKSCMESLCVLCIQALAEMNRWPEVLPLVQETYSGIETCPHTVVQLCLLLHARVDEFTQCYAIASIWLRHEDNANNPEYIKVVTVYIKHVMIPQGQLVLVPQFLNSCTLLSDSDKDDIVKKSETLWKREIEANKQLQEEGVDKHQHSERKLSRLKSEEIIVYEGSEMVDFAKRLCSALIRQFSYINLRTIVKVAFVSIGICLLAKQTIGGDLLSNTWRARTVWEGTWKILKTMFSPYRPGR